MPGFTPPPFLAAGVNNPIIPAKPWTTQEVPAIDAAVNLQDCVARIPRNVNEYTDLIHWHEMAHVKWTEGPGIFGQTEPGMWDHILREPQVNILLARELKVDVSKAMRAFDWAEHPVPIIPRDAAMLWINLSYYLRDSGNASLIGFVAKLEEKIRDQWNGTDCMNALADAVREVMRDPTALTRQRWAVKLAELFAPPPPAPELAPEVEAATKAATEAAEKAEAEARKKEVNKLRQEMAEQTAAGSKIDNMQIHHHLTKARPGRRLSNPGSHRNTGIIPVRFDRFCTDKMLFRIRKVTGSMVIDCSGSMHWDWDALKSALTKLPNMTVAAYQGVSYDDDFDGRLCVIAKDGRWTDHMPANTESDLSGGNEVDYQALLWLASQPQPRVWLSDGHITGGNKANTVQNCDAILDRAKIIRLGDLDSALAYFSGKTVAAFKDCYGSRPITTRKR